MRFVNKIGRDTVLLRIGQMEKSAYLTRRRYTPFKDTYLMYTESIK